MHVGSVLVFEGPTPDYDAFVAHIERGLHLVPRYRQRLAFPPFGVARPVWVDDPHFNVTLPPAAHGAAAAGRRRRAARLAGRVFSQQLDREKPLWEIWLVDELGDGRFALICKTHHALVDGISGVDILTVLFDITPDAPEPEPGPPWAPQPLPSGAELLGARAGGTGDRAGRARALGARASRSRRRRRRPLGRRARLDGGGGDRGRAAVAAERADRAAPALRLGDGGAGAVQGDQGRARRDDQRRRPDRRHRRVARASVPARARPRRARAQGDGADLGARGRRAAARSATRSRRCTRRCRSGSRTRSSASATSTAR